MSKLKTHFWNEVNSSVFESLAHTIHSETKHGNVVIGMKEWMKLTHLSVFHSISNRAHEKRSRNSISSAAQDAFNTFFFCHEQETVRHPRYMI